MVAAVMIPAVADSQAGLTEAQARHELKRCFIETHGTYPELVEIGECIRRPESGVNYFEFKVVHPPVGTAIVLTSGPVLLPIGS